MSAPDVILQGEILALIDENESVHDEIRALIDENDEIRALIETNRLLVATAMKESSVFRTTETTHGVEVEILPSVRRNEDGGASDQHQHHQKIIEHRPRDAPLSKAASSTINSTINSNSNSSKPTKGSWKPKRKKSYLARASKLVRSKLHRRNRDDSHSIPPSLTLANTFDTQSQSDSDRDEAGSIGNIAGASANASASTEVPFDEHGVTGTLAEPGPSVPEKEDRGSSSLEPEESGDDELEPSRSRSAEESRATEQGLPSVVVDGASSPSVASAETKIDAEEPLPPVAPEEQGEGTETVPSSPAPEAEPSEEDRECASTGSEESIDDRERLPRGELLGELLETDDAAEDSKQSDNDRERLPSLDSEESRGADDPEESSIDDEEPVSPAELEKVPSIDDSNRSNENHREPRPSVGSGESQDAAKDSKVSSDREEEEQLRSYGFEEMEEMPEHDDDDDDDDDEPISSCEKDDGCPPAVDPIDPKRTEKDALPVVSKGGDEPQVPRSIGSIGSEPREEDRNQPQPQQHREKAPTTPMVAVQETEVEEDDATEVEPSTNDGRASRAFPADSDSPEPVPRLLPSEAESLEKSPDPRQLHGTRRNNSSKNNNNSSSSKNALVLVALACLVVGIGRVAIPDGSVPNNPVVPSGSNVGSVEPPHTAVAVAKADPKPNAAPHTTDKRERRKQRRKKRGEQLDEMLSTLW